MKRPPQSCKYESADILIKIKLRKPFRPVKVAEPHHLIFLEHVFLRPPVLAADTAVDASVFIVEHIDVEIPHKAGWTSVI